jgi:hypothetical protein
VKALPNHESQGNQGEDGHQGQAPTNHQPFGIELLPPGWWRSSSFKALHELISFAVMTAFFGVKEPELIVLLCGTQIHIQGHSQLSLISFMKSTRLVSGFPLYEFVFLRDVLAECAKK